MMKTLSITTALVACMTLGTFATAQALPVATPSVVDSNQAAAPQLQMVAAKGKLHFAIKGVATDDSEADDNGQGEDGHEGVETPEGQGESQDGN